MQSNKPLLIIAVLILIMNVTLISRISDLNNQVNALRQNYNHLQSNLNSISGNVNNTLNQFTREQSWITPVQVNNEKSRVENDQVTAVLNWQIKDYQDGAEVFFHYRQSESGEFAVLPAENKGAGFFEVSLPIKIKAEPMWEVRASKTTTGEALQHINEKQEQINQAIGYYVSMKINDLTKSSDIAYFDIAYLTRTKYEPIQGHVDINNSKCNITIYEHYAGSSNYQAITASFYEDNHLIEEKIIPIQHTDNDIKIYSLVYDAGDKTISRLKLQVKYNNGRTFEKVF